MHGPTNPQTNNFYSVFRSNNHISHRLSSQICKNGYRRLLFLKTGLPACLPSFLPCIPLFVRRWPSCKTSKPSKTTRAYLIPEVAHTWQAGGATDRGETWRNNSTLQRLPFQENSARPTSAATNNPPKTSSCCLACPCLAFVRSFLTWSSQKRRRCRLFEGSLTTTLCREQNNPNVDTRDKKSVVLEYSCDHNALLTNEIRTTWQDHENRIAYSHGNDAQRLLYSSAVFSSDRTNGEYLVVRESCPERNEGSRGEGEVQRHSFLTSALDAGKCSGCS